MEHDGSTNDVEKRWRDPAAVKAAVRYVATFLALSLAALAATVAWKSLIAAILVPGMLLIGGVGALVRTYRVWKAEGVWPIWQAAAWILLLLGLFFLGVPFGFA